MPRRLSLLLTVAALGGCSSPPEPLPGCDLPNLDTSDWELLTSRSGMFALELPAGATEQDVVCIDSPCGVIEVGDWTLHYDVGPLAGSGDLYAELDPARFAVFDRCEYPLDKRQLFVTTYRRTEQNGTSEPMAAVAAAELEPGVGLYFFMYTSLGEDVREFVQAVTATEISYGDELKAWLNAP